MDKVRVTIWNEFVHEKEDGPCKELYPEGIHKYLADALSATGEIETRTATLEEPDHGLTEEVLDNTDVLIWFGHAAHPKVDDAIVSRVQQYVLSGMGLIPLHSSHFSKIFQRMMGTNCSLTWRCIGERERLWNCAPSHPITQGIGEYIDLKNTEMYGEPFDIPTPEDVIFISWFQGGEVFRSGCTWKRGNGKIFYFKPGHETYPVFKNEEIQKVIANACKWARPVIRKGTRAAPGRKTPLEKVG